MKTKKNYYVLEIWGDVEPILHGPFKKQADRDDCYEKLAESDPNGRNGLYTLSSTEKIKIE